MAGLRLAGLSKTYPNSTVPAVQSFDLNCPDGSFIALLGPSGCGKTSTLRMIAGLEPISSGRLYIGDRVMNDVPPKDRGVGLAFENYALYPPLTVFENIAFNLRAKGVDRAALKSRVERIAELLGIKDILRSKPAGLSGGQKQRVNIARALVREPKLLLLDEPLSHLDARARLQMRTELKRLHVEVGATTVIVTHDQLEAMALADVIAILDNGVLQQVGSPAEVYNFPENEFVAGFIGEPPMNIFPVEVNLDPTVETTAQFVLLGTDFRLGVPPHLLGMIGAQRLKLGIRTHRIRVRHEPSAGSTPAVVAVAEHLGDETRLLIRYGDVDLIVTLPITRSLRAKQHVYLEFDAAHTLLFDADTGVRLQTDAPVPTPKPLAAAKVSA